MGPNLLDMANKQLTGEALERTGACLGETTESTRRAFGAALPAVLAGFISHASRASSDPEKSAFIHALLETPDDVSLLEHLPAGGEAPTDAVTRTGREMLGPVFGDRLPAVVDHVAGGSGISKGTATKVLGLATPLLAAIVRREARTRDLGGLGIATMLVEQKSTMWTVPRGGELARLFAAKERLPNGEASFDGGRGPRGIPLGRRLGLPLPLFALGAALAALFVLSRGREVTTSTLPDASRAVDVGAPAQLFGGGPLDPAEQLKRFFANPNEPVPKRIVLSGVSFAADSAELVPVSRISIDSVAIALNRDRKAQVRLEGFIHPTGNAQFDQRLRLQRAAAVRDELVRRGVDAERIEVAGGSGEQPGASVGGSEIRGAPAGGEGRGPSDRIDLIVVER